MPTPNDQSHGARSVGRRREDHVRARLAAIVRSSSDAIIGETLDGIITDWNPAAERLYGYTAAEVIGQHRSILIPPEEVSAVDAMAARVQHGEPIADVETVRWTKDGRRLDVALTVSPVWGDAGELIATSVIIRDITARKATEAALATSEARVSTLLAHVPAVIYTEQGDETGPLTYISPYVEAFLGFPPQAFLADGELWLRRVHPDDRDRVRASAERVHNTGAPLAEDYRMVTRTGQIVWVHDVAAPLRDSAAGVLGWQGMALDITARKTAEEALFASEALFRTAFANAPVGMVLASPDLRTLQVNRALCAMLGYSEDDLLDTDLWRLTYPEDIVPNRALVQRALAGEFVSYELEKRYIHKDGHLVWAHLSGSLVRDAAGAPRYFISQIQDITARKSSEAAFAQLTAELQASETRFRTLVEQLPAAVYLLANNDAHETPLYFSPAIAAITGETSEEAMTSHRHWLDLVHPEDRTRVAAEDERAGARVESFRAEYRHGRKDGSYIWVQDEYVPVKDETGRAVAWLGMLLDITDRMRAEEAQARLAAIVESAEDAIVSSTVAGIITSWNRGAERLYAYCAAEAIGQSFTMLLPDDLDDLTSQRRRAALAGESVAPFETRRRRRDGATFPASVALSPIRDRDGRIIGISSITRDITDRHRLEAELRAALEASQAAVRTKSLFLAMMSHELRTPLQAVLGYADFLHNGPPGSLTAEQREDIGYIRQGAGRMVTLIEQLLDLSRMEAGRLELAAAPVALEMILEQVRQDVAPLITAKALAFAIDLPAALPPVWGDAVRVRQILLNLVGNAVKFTEAGSISITAHQSADSVAVVVRDTGIGISQEALPLIFEEFRQVDASLTRRHGGAGLGLAIARKLAEHMGGHISVESMIGVGSTFTLWLPVAPLTRQRSPIRR
jgi:PAS domain S-box-containing protein